jgi:two-component system, NarL family, sensor histidine kinase DesK
MALISDKQRRGANWVHICYLVFFLIGPILKPTLGMWLGSLAVIAVFLPIYGVYVQTDRDSVRGWMVAATFALAIVSLPWNPSGAVTFFIYTAAFTPFTTPRTKVVLALLVLESVAAVGLVYLLERREWTHGAWINAATALLLVWGIGMGNLFHARERRADCKLRMAQQEIETLAAVAERERIARDLHDVLGHTLSVMAMKAELAGRLLRGSGAQGESVARAVEEIRDVETMGRTALTEVREPIGGYRGRGFGAEMEHSRLTLLAAGVSLEVDKAGWDGAGIGAAEETAMALALREAVTNIVRHAQATECRLRLVTVEGRRRLIVEDNGRTGAGAAREGNGLRGMRERVEALGGRVELDREKGTRLMVELPLRAGGVVG